MAPDSKRPIVSATAGIEVLTREVNGELFVLACKREGATVNAEFSGLPAGARMGEVMFEAPRTVQAKAGKFTDWFGPFEVHVYRFRSAHSRQTPDAGRRMPDARRRTPDAGCRTPDARRRTPDAGRRMTDD